MTNSRFKFRAFVPWLQKKIFEVERMFFDYGGLYALQLFANEYHRYDIHSDLPAWEKEPPILIQFTGLLDCDGKEIFEGDYVQYSKEEPNKCPIFEVKFIDGAFVGSLETNCGGMRSHDMCHLKELCCDEYYVDGKANFKIIGNRFENHDILVSK